MPNKQLLTMSLVLIGLLILSIIITSKTQNTSKILLPDGTQINLEIADTQFKRAQGLMFRKSLPQDSGMFFIFDSSQIHTFWMKNTLIPLDMVWIDENFSVGDVTYNALPCQPNETCQTYYPQTPAKYVLEINSGAAEKFGISVGTKLTFVKGATFIKN